MDRFLRSRCARVLAWLLAWGSLVSPVSAQRPLRTAYDRMRSVDRRVHENKNPPSPRDEGVENLAREIDWLEHLIETYGSVVPKHPDIWGESRLARHRSQLEDELKKQFSAEKFTDTFSAAIRRSDQSFLALALSLNGATNGATAATTNAATAMILPSSNNAGTPNPSSSGVFATAPSTGFIDFGTPNTAANSNFRLGVEPDTHVDQLHRYLQHLNTLRRINEGDDTADSPGYALNLVRIPVSVLPGKRTRAGYGAEITFTVEPYFTPQMLPDAIRPLITNDVVEQNALAMTTFFNNDPVNARKQLELFQKSRVVASQWLDAYDTWLAEKAKEIETIADPVQFAIAQRNLKSLHDSREYLEHRMLGFVVLWNDNPGHEFKILVDGATVTLTASDLYQWLSELYKNKSKSGWSAPMKLTVKTLIAEAQQSAEIRLWGLCEFKVDQTGRGPQLPFSLVSVDSTNDSKKTLGLDVDKLVQQVISQYARSRTISVSIDAILKATEGSSIGDIAFIGVSPMLPKHGKRPLNHVKYRLVVGELMAGEMAFELNQILQRNLANQQSVHLLDVRRRLDEEAQHAYDFLLTDQGRGAWDLATPELARAIEELDAEKILATKKSYFEVTGGSLRGRMIDSLAWQIICEAALLNERLREDMARVAETGGCPQLVDAGQLKFVGPKEQITPQASEAFREYVKARWPIITFAIDPITQEQNVADAFSRRRELQLAVAAAVADGKLNPQAAGRFVRRQELELETVALNRTAVSFSHGNDTFGWRFYPRVQTPDTPGTITAFGQTLFGGPRRGSDIRQRELEPATRECYVVIIMPSFVPYVTIDSRANWFGLTNPEKKELTLHDAMRISRNYAAIQRSIRGFPCEMLYRPGDVGHMTKAIEQLERRMPLQQSKVQVPYLNSLGGYDLFATSTDGLGPRLEGWYGAPGINLDGETTLYLVGDKFSTLETSVIAGGTKVTSNLLSRRILEVKIPKGVQVLSDNVDKRDFSYVDIHVATPYGPSAHLLVPTVKKQPPKEDPKPVFKFAPFQWRKVKLDLVGDYKLDANKIPTFLSVRVDGPQLIQFDSPSLALPASIDVELKVGLTNGTPGETSKTVPVAANYDARQQLFVLEAGAPQAIAKAVMELLADRYTTGLVTFNTTALRVSISATCQTTDDAIRELIIGDFSVALKLNDKSSTPTPPAQSAPNAASYYDPNSAAPAFAGREPMRAGQGGAVVRSAPAALRSADAWSSAAVQGDRGDLQSTLVLGAPSLGNR